MLAASAAPTYVVVGGGLSALLVGLVAVGIARWLTRRWRTRNSHARHRR
jgi:uncharacterized protein involved in exopolysaccharide biosynthesis